MLKKRIIWLVTNLAYIILMYLWIFNDIVQAGNIIKFITTLHFFLILFVFICYVISEKSDKPELKKEHNRMLKIWNNRAVPIYICIIYDIIIIVLFASIGSYVLATFYFLSSILSNSIYSKAKEEMKLKINEDIDV